MFKKYGNIGIALKSAYPDYPWELSKFELRSKKSAQRWLLLKMSSLLPKDTVIIEDYRSSELTKGDTSKSVQFDIWIPSLNLVLEYQGEYHSVELLDSGFAPVGDVQQRDSEKKELCEKNGLLYVPVHFWWDGKKDSLSSTLHQYLPEVFPKTDSPPIPPILPPDYKPRTKTGEARLKNLKHLMHGLDFKEDDPKVENPMGWFMTEKYDGIRAYWDGKQFWSRGGNFINVPESFKAGLPIYHLDGEFWGGYEENAVMTHLLKLSCGKRKIEIDWDKVKFCVFDAPQEEATYDKRHLFLQKNFSQYNNKHILLIPMKECKGLIHLKESLEEIINKGGEGMMIYRPDTIYQPGRSRNVLKIKKYFDAEVKFLQVDEENSALVCEQAGGHKISVKCKRIYCFEPPEQGAIIPVLHQGFFAHSQKYKYPVMNTSVYEESFAKENSNIETTTKGTKLAILSKNIE
jgi:hypothetical protein